VRRKNFVERLVVMGEVTKGAVGMSSIFFLKTYSNESGE
jgi:hypothetical protein